MPLSEAVVMGELNSQNAPYVLEQLRRSADYAMSGKSVGVATAPVQKSVINDAGIHFSGHTEYYQEFAGVERVVMMLATKTVACRAGYYTFAIKSCTRCDYQRATASSD